MRLTRRAALGFLATSPALAQGQDWPNRRLRLVVPSAAGGYEVYARILAPRLAELLGQPVVVDNKPGANGIIGMQEVHRSPPDGYTFMFAHVGAISIGSSIYPNMPFDPVEDLSSISVAVTSPLVWVLNPALPFRTMPEFIARVQAEPGNWRYGLPASGSIPHLVVEDTKIRHKLDMPAVPYRSTPQSLMAVISGEVPITLDSLGASSGHVAGGKLRALAITSRERSERLPEVPTMLEARPRSARMGGLVCFHGAQRNTRRDHSEAEHRDQSGACGKTPSPRASANWALHPASRRRPRR